MRSVYIALGLVCCVLVLASYTVAPVGSAVAGDITEEAAAENSTSPAPQGPTISPSFGYRWVESGGPGPPEKQYEVHISGIAEPNENLIVCLQQNTKDTNLHTRFKFISAFMKSEATGAFKARIPFKTAPSNDQTIQIVVSTGTKFQRMAAAKSVETVGDIIRADQLIDKEVTGAYIAAHAWGKDDTVPDPMRTDVCSVLADAEARWYKYTDNTVCPPVDHYYVKVTGAYGTIEDCLTVSFDYDPTEVPNVIESTICSVNGAGEFCAIFYQGTDVTPLLGLAIIHYPTHDEYVDADDGVDQITGSLAAFLAQASYCAPMFAE